MNLLFLILIFAVLVALCFLFIVRSPIKSPTVNGCTARKFKVSSVNSTGADVIEAWDKRRIPLYMSVDVHVDTFRKANLSQLAAASASLPGYYGKGTSGPEVLSCTGWATLPFASNTGNLEWYIGYMQDTTSSFMLYLSKALVIPGDVDSACFTWACMISQSNGEVYREGPIALKGVYVCEKDAFTLTCSGLTVNFSVKGNSGILTFARRSKSRSFQCEISSSTAPALNGPGGCSPCTDGMGTSYSSLTLCSYSVTGAVTLVGEGWLDHQIQATTPKTRLAALAMTLGNVAAGLQHVKYVWLTLRTSKGQLMASWLPKTGPQGNSFKSIGAKNVKIYNAPKSSDVVFIGDIPAQFTMTLDDVVEDGGPVSFPTVVSFENFKHPEIHKIGLPPSFTASLAYYGRKQYFIDNSGNAHLFASCLIRDSDGNVIGQGVVEINHLQTDETYERNYRSLLPPGFTPASAKVRFWVLFLILLIPASLTVTAAVGLHVLQNRASSAAS